MNGVISDGRLLLPNGEIIEGDLGIEDGRIAVVGQARGRRLLDAAGGLVLPGIVDIHGDAFEHFLSPRPGALMPWPLALSEAANHMLAGGITTAYFSQTYTWEPGNRDKNNLCAFMETFDQAGKTLGLDAKRHLRFEIYHMKGKSDVSRLLENGKVDMLSFNDHLAHYLEVLEKPNGPLRMADKLKTEPERCRELLGQVGAKKGEALELVVELAEICRQRLIPMASHDEAELSVRQWYHDLGCYICEFPVNLETARLASELGDFVVAGAPNIMKGASLYGRLSSRRLLKEGLLDILASDYYYPAQLQSIFLLERLGLGEVGRLWDMVSLNPSRSAGLLDRGRIQEGMRADLIVVDYGPQGFPVVRDVLIEGRRVFYRRR